MENIQGDSFKKGQKVYCLVNGWGTVTEVQTIHIYPVLVDFGGKLCSYTTEGQILVNSNRTLFFKDPALTIPEDCYKVSEVTYSRGEFFKDSVGDVYMLLHTSATGNVVLSSLSGKYQGNRWNDPIAVKDVHKITQKEFEAISDGLQLEKIDNPLA